MPCHVAPLGEKDLNTVMLYYAWESVKALKLNLF